MAVFALAALAALGACGGTAVGVEVGQISGATGIPVTEADLFLTEADAGRVSEATTFQVDIGAPDKKGVILTLEGDDASSLRWRFAEKPDLFLVEWYRADDRLAFETGDLIGDPVTAKKVLELRPIRVGETAFVLELVERDPADRGGEPETPGAHVLGLLRAGEGTNRGHLRGTGAVPRHRVRQLYLRVGLVRLRPESARPLLSSS